MRKSTAPVMGHLVLGYPTLEKSIENALAYAEAGFKILELQIPFSHPTADGTVITNANRIAVESNKVSVKMCFDAFALIKKSYPSIEIIAMTYLNKIFSFGLHNFIEECQTVGIKNLIIPDLPFDDPIAQKINQSGKCKLVPVLAANTKDSRIDLAIEAQPEHFYLMSEFKITGQGFGIHENLENKIQKIKSKSTAKVGIGFGISTKDHVEMVTKIADYAIIGSALINADNSGKLSEKLKELTSL